MKRFITYLYEYKNGRKNRNTGFVRINIRDGVLCVDIYIQNYSRADDIGKAYLLLRKSKVMGVEIGTIEVKNGIGTTTLQIAESTICDSGFSIDDISGMAILFTQEERLCAIWRESEEKFISACEFVEWKQGNEENNTQTCPVVYQKIELDQIRNLPSKNWHFCTNSFLVHGYWNYGYLVVKTEMEEGKKSVYLGVPGIYEKPEMLMAVLFGFTEYEAIPEGVKTAKKDEILESTDIKRNQEPTPGEFGCWFVRIQI